MSKWKIDERLKREGNRILYTDGRAAYVQTNEGEATFAVYEVAEEALELLERVSHNVGLMGQHQASIDTLNDLRAFLAKHKQEERIEAVTDEDCGDAEPVAAALNQLLKDVAELKAR